MKALSALSSDGLASESKGGLQEAAAAGGDSVGEPRAMYWLHSCCCCCCWIEVVVVVVLLQEGCNCP
jgi:hypothetical protein